MLFGTALASNASGDGRPLDVRLRVIGYDMPHVVAGSEPPGAYIILHLKVPCSAERRLT